MPYSAFSLRRLFPAACFALLLLSGCGRFSPAASREYVYVWAKQDFLHDRVAPVNNIVATVTNGERLEVLEHGGRFLKVKTPQGQIGWIEEHGILTRQTADKFAQLAREHAGDPVVASGVLRDEYWMRDAPGRESDRFYLLPENTKLQLLERASVPRPEPPQPLPLPAKGDKATPPAPAMEDYWLARDSAGHVGWVRSRTLDENVPDAIATLAEGQKIVAAYRLRTVSDPDAGTPNGQVGEYLTLLDSWQDGLPWDFDQVRVFTWNTRKHRYETAWRERNIEGFLPVTVSQQTFGREQDPVFSFRVATTSGAAFDPKTGLPQPGPTAVESYRMEGVIVRPIAGPSPQPEARPQKKLERRAKRRIGRGR